MSARRQVAVGALAFVVLILVAFLVPGTPPKFNASSAKIASFFHDHHKAVLISIVLFGIAMPIFIAVISQLCRTLSDAGQADLVWPIGVGAAAFVAILTTGIGIYAGLAQVATTGGSPDTMRTLYQVSSFVTIPLGWVALAVVIPVAVAGLRGAFARWTVWLNVVIAVLSALSGVAVKASGAFAAGSGFFAILGLIAFLVFMLEVGFLLWSTAEARAPQTATSLQA
jgi:hypothetical protein